MNNFVEIVVPGLIAVLCIARQFIAGVTAFPPLRGFNPRHQHQNGGEIS